MPKRPLPIDCPACIAIALQNVEWFAAGQPKRRPDARDNFMYAPIIFAEDASKVLGGIALAAILGAAGLR